MVKFEFGGNLQIFDRVLAIFDLGSANAKAILTFLVE